MSLRSLKIVLATVVFGSCVVAQAMASEPVVEACLAASFYPDGEVLFRSCSDAADANGLDSKTTAKINLQLGAALYFAHRPGMALTYLDNAIKLDPQLDQAWRRRGWAHYQMGHGSAALSDFTEFLALAPDDPDALFALSFARQSQSSDCAAAARAYEQILAHEPAHYLTKLSLASMYACTDGNHVRQLEQLDQIIGAGRELTSKVTYYGRFGRDDYDFYAYVRAHRSDLYFDLGRFDDAIAETSWLIATYPSIPAAYRTRAAARLATDDNAGALADSQFALDQFPNDLDAQASKLKALTKLGRNADAVVFASDAIRGGAPASSAAALYFWRGLAFKGIGQKIEAVRDMNTAMSLDRRYLWSVDLALRRAGYILGAAIYYGRDPDPDLTSPQFANALEACMLDPECVPS